MKNINNKVSTPSKGAGATSSSSVFDKILAMPTGGQSNGGTYSLDTKLALGVDVEVTTGMLSLILGVVLLSKL